MEDSPILIDEPLTETFIPTRLLHRDGQVKEASKGARKSKRDYIKSKLNEH